MQTHTSVYTYLHCFSPHMLQPDTARAHLAHLLARVCLCLTIGALRFSSKLPASFWVQVLGSQSLHLFSRDCVVSNKTLLQKPLPNAMADAATLRRCYLTITQAKVACKSWVDKVVSCNWRPLSLESFTKHYLGLLKGLAKHTARIKAGILVKALTELGAEMSLETKDEFSKKVAAAFSVALKKKRNRKDGSRMAQCYVQLIAAIEAGKSTWTAPGKPKAKQQLTLPFQSAGASGSQGPDTNIWDLFGLTKQEPHSPGLSQSSETEIVEISDESGDDEGEGGDAYGTDPESEQESEVGEETDGQEQDQEEQEEEEEEGDEGAEEDFGEEKEEEGGEEDEEEEGEKEEDQEEEQQEQEAQQGPEETEVGGGKDLSRSSPAATVLDVPSGSEGEDAADRSGGWILVFANPLKGTATCRHPKGDGMQSFQLVRGPCLTARVSLPGSCWLPTEVPNEVLPGAPKPKGKAKAKAKAVLKKPAAKAGSKEGRAEVGEPRDLQQQVCFFFFMGGRGLSLWHSGALDIHIYIYIYVFVGG